MERYKHYIVPAIALIIGLAGGYNIGEHTAGGHHHGKQEKKDIARAHNHEEEEHAHHEHLNVPEEIPAPRVSIALFEKDVKGGWNLKLETENFTFSPERASEAHVLGEGHAHLYIDGEKVTRLYNNWYHIPHLEEGEHHVRVTLNTNDHKDYSSSEGVAEDNLMVFVE